MDWSRARTILLAAFTVVNLILAYSVWGPTGLFPYPDETPQGQTMEQLRETLFNRKLVLPANVSLPRTPEPMKFLRVELLPAPDLIKWAFEVSGMTTAPGPREDTFLAESLRPTVDPVTHATDYFPGATGLAAHEVKLDSREQVTRVAEDYLRVMSLLPPGAHFSGITE
ncbi:MAG TPA: hypothetical protein VNT01_15765, partial [Symbiobacteriaceae bacterium]|nr:hypothetical protein [Symbiobacteriaceae bacterium]